MWYEFNQDKTKVTIKHPRTVGERWIRNEEVPELLKWLPNYNLTLSKVDENGTHYYTTNVCYACSGSGVVKMPNREYYECTKCDGSGKLKRKKTFKVHTKEYGEVLEEEYMKKQHQDFFDRYGINEDGSCYVYIGNTFPIKDQLKEKGAKYNSILSKWLSKEPIEGFQFIKVSVPLKVHEDKSIGFDFGYDTKTDEKVNNLLDELKAFIRKAEEQL